MLEERTPKIIGSQTRFKKTVQTISFLMRTYQQNENLVDQAKAALMIPPSQRTYENKETILRLMSHYKYFAKLKQKFGNNFFQMFCENLYYKRYEAGKEVIKIHQEGTEFYIIMGGTVGVYAYQPRDRKTITVIKGNNDQMHLLEDLTLFQQVEINILGVGESFGELSLLEAGAKTTATIIAKENCEFACLDRQSYWEMLGKIQQQELYDKINFLKTLSFLQEWSDQDLKTLSYHFKPITLNRHHRLFEIGEKCNGVYFVKEGELELWSCINKPPKIMHNDIETVKRDNNKSKEMILVSMLTKGEFFGEEELYNQDTRVYTVICSSQTAIVYKVAKIDLEKRLWIGNSRQLLVNLALKCVNFRRKRVDQLINYKSIITDNQNYETEIKQQLNEIKLAAELNEVIPKQIVKKQSRSFHSAFEKIQSNDQNHKPEVDLLHAGSQLSQRFLFDQKPQEQHITHETQHKNNQWIKIDVFERAKMMGLRYSHKGLPKQIQINREKDELFKKELAKMRKRFFPKSPDLIKQLQITETKYPLNLQMPKIKSLNVEQSMKADNQSSRKAPSRKRLVSEVNPTASTSYSTFRKSFKNSTIPIEITPLTSRSNTVTRIGSVSLHTKPNSPSHERRISQCKEIKRDSILIKPCIQK